MRHLGLRTSKGYATSTGSRLIPLHGAAPERSTNEGVGARCLCGTTPDPLAELAPSIYLRISGQMARAPIPGLTTHGTQTN